MASTTTTIDPGTKTTAPSAIGPAARGWVTSRAGDRVTFAPDGTNYKLHLVCPDYDGPIGVPVTGVIRVRARKAYSVLSGGNFVHPIFGPPRTIQGWVLAVEGNAIVMHAGTRFHVQMPDEASAVELANGPIRAGTLVNVVALPGAAFEPAR